MGASRFATSVMGLSGLVVSGLLSASIAQAGPIAVRGGESDSPGSAAVWGISPPVAPPDVDSGVVAVAAGGYHALALKNGRVIAWGGNEAGQTTVPAEALSGVSAIAARGNVSLALKSGRVIAWGSSNFGQLDVPADAQTGISAISVGRGHVLALKDGRVIAWGDNASGQTTVPSEAQSGVSAVAAGCIASFALKAGRVLFWGLDPQGVMRPPTDTQSGIKEIAAGCDFALALTEQGRVIAWGYRDAGSLVPSDAQIGVSAISAGPNWWTAIKDGRLLAPHWPSDRIPVWTRSGVLATAVGGENWGVVIKGPVVPPGVVSNLRAAPRPGSVALGWAAPLESSDPKGVTYEYRVGAGGWTAITATKVVVRGAKGRSLTISVRAVNSAGPGPLSTVTAKPR